MHLSAPHKFLFPTTAQGEFPRSYLFRLSIVAISAQLQYYKDTSSVLYCIFVYHSPTYDTLLVSL